MQLSIALLDDGSDDIKDRLNELKHSGTFEICGVCAPAGTLNGARVPLYEDISTMLSQASPDVVAIYVKDELVLSSFKETIKQCKNIIISRLAPLPLEILHELSELAKNSNASVILDLPHRFHPVILSLKKELLKEEQIYSMSVTGINPKAPSIVELLVNNIDLASFTSGSEVYGGKDLSCTILARDGAYSQASLKLIMPTSQALCMQCSMLGEVQRHFIEVATSGGIYFADLLGRKLYMQSEIGQINLRVDADSSEVRVQYRAFYDYFMQNDKTTTQLGGIDEIIKIKELFA